MSEFTCGQHTYSAGQLDARAQFHIVRRLAPVLKGLAPIIAKVAKGEVDPKNINPQEGLDAIPEIANVLASMDDITADYVIFGLLTIVKRKQENGLGWAPITSGTNLMFMDITMPQMLTLAGRALAANLGDFFGVLNSALSQQSQKPSGQ